MPKFQWNLILQSSKWYFCIIYWLQVSIQYDQCSSFWFQVLTGDFYVSSRPVIAPKFALESSVYAHTHSPPSMAKFGAFLPMKILIFILQHLKMDQFQSIWVIHWVLSGKLFPLQYQLYCLLGLRGVLMQHYSYIICLNRDMVPCIICRQCVVILSGKIYRCQ